LAFKRDFILICGGRIASGLIALISIRAATTFLIPEQFGRLALLNVVLSFCGLFLVNPVGQYINLHTHDWWGDGSLITRLNSYRYYVLLVSLFGFMAMLIVDRGDSLISFLGIAFIMALMVISSTWNATLIPMLNMLGFRTQSVLLTILTLLVGMIASISISYIIPSATAWFFGQAIGMSIGALWAEYFLKRNSGEIIISTQHSPFISMKVFLNYCIPLALATGLMWIQLSGYRFLIEDYWGLVQLGFLAVGLQLTAQIWSLVESLCMQFINPLFYRRISNYQDQVAVKLAYSDLLNTLIPVYFVITGFLILSAPYLVRVLVSEQYQGATKFFIIGSGIEMCRVFGNLLSNAAHINRKTKSLLLPYGIGALITLFLIYFFGETNKEVLWAAIGLLIGVFFMLVTMVYCMYKQINFSIDIIRCTIGLITFILMIIMSYWLPDLSSLILNIIMLLSLGCLSGLIIYSLLYRNPVLMRFLNINLQER